MNDARHAHPASSRSVSVALATFNSGDYIEHQLRSILDQTRPVDEVLVSDDGSTDGTPDRVRRIAKDHPRGGVVSVVEGRVGGVSANFQRALERVTGDLVVLSDHDDVWRQDRIEKALSVFPDDADTPALVFSDARLVDENGDPRGRTLFEAYAVSDQELAWVQSQRAFEVLGWRNIVTGATVMVNRRLVEMGLPLPPRWIHDEWLAVIAAAAGRIVVVREPLIDYRIHGRNQIGVPPRNPFALAFIALKVGASRYDNLLRRSQFLDERLARENCCPEPRALLAERMAFEGLRLGYGPLPPLRAGRIAAVWRSGAYHRFSRQPRAEALRDLLQRP